jgi:signal peptide peptidase SppA
MLEQRHFEWMTASNANNQSYKNSFTKVVKNINQNISIIPIHGVLTKRSGVFDNMLGMTSYDEIREQVTAALADDSTDTILLDIDSPGGETSGLFDLADFIYASRSQKRIWAIANDEAYSAAYAIASSAEKVFVSRTSGVGSIGVIASHIDQSLFDEKQGIKYTTVFAGNRKNDLTPHEPINFEALQGLQEEVNRLYEMFVELVARNRGFYII